MESHFRFLETEWPELFDSADYALHRIWFCKKKWIVFLTKEEAIDSFNPWILS
jgi:hypothetical protein